jgi:YdjC-like protein
MNLDATPRSGPATSCRVPFSTESAVQADRTGATRRPLGEPRRGGVLIVNADDWGRDRQTTSAIRDCAVRGAVSAVSGMVFMDDSERAASIARELGIDTALHVNLTLPFSAGGCPGRLVEHQRKLMAYLRAHRLARIVYHPGLVRSFEYVVAAQFDEFRRLYGADPQRVDGHHHMHLCANVQVQRLLPPGTLVRRNFSFQPGEKSVWNRLYRRLVDGRLSRRHRLLDYLFPLAPLEPPGRLQRIFALARDFAVEVETHPVNREEYEFLTGGEIFRHTRDVRLGSSSLLPGREHHTTDEIS